MKRSFCFLVFVAVLMWSAIARAQVVPEGENEPAFGQQELAAPQVTVDDPTAAPSAALSAEEFRILAIGDALGGGLGAGLTRLGQDISVTNRFNESSGIARPEIYDWTAAVARVTEDETFNAAVVLIGSNDRQDIRLGQFRYAFNTPDWQEAYKLQVDGLLDALKAKGMQVFWVNIPPMADPTYNADMMTLNTIIKERVSAQGETFVDVRAAFLAADGSYTDRGPDSTGEIRKLRARDGVTFFKEGNNRMAQLVLAAIDERRKSGAVEAGKSSGAVSDFPPTPVLGQSLGGGSSETFETAEIAKALADLEKKQPEENDIAKVVRVPEIVRIKIIDAVAASGSGAEKLLTTGVAEAAPAGRFDDFSVVAPTP